MAFYFCWGRFVVGSAIQPGPYSAFTWHRSVLNLGGLMGMQPCPGWVAVLALSLSILTVNHHLVGSGLSCLLRIPKREQSPRATPEMRGEEMAPLQRGNFLICPSVVKFFHWLIFFKIQSVLLFCRYSQRGEGWAKECVRRMPAWCLVQMNFSNPPVNPPVHKCRVLGWWWL